MKMTKVAELACGIVLCAALIAISAIVAIPILWTGINSLPAYFNVNFGSSVYLSLFMAIGVVVVFNFSNNIQRSNYLRGQAILLAITAFVLYIALRFLTHLHEAEFFAGIGVVGTVGILGFISIIRIILFSME